jgi:hypothetical protein
MRSTILNLCGSSHSCLHDMYHTIIQQTICIAHLANIVFSVIYNVLFVSAPEKLI